MTRNSAELGHVAEEKDVTRANCKVPDAVAVLLKCKRSIAKVGVFDCGRTPNKV